MNTLLIKSTPVGDFSEISVLMEGWQSKFDAMVNQNRPIKFDMYPLRHIPQEFASRLSQKQYQDQIIENDRWVHFLLPSSN